MDEYDVPNIVLHTLCQSRICGNISSGHTTVVCDGCPSAFNCLTGNVDDGLVDKVGAEERQDRKIIQKVELIKEAEEKVAEAKRKATEKHMLDLAATLRKQGFSFGVPIDNLGWSARYCGTVWKLDTEDLKAILDNSWHTPKTVVMKNTFSNRKLNPDSVRELLSQLIPS